MVRFSALWLLLFLSAHPASAQTGAPPAAAVVRDYGSGFRLLQALGLPDVKEAQYCAISTRGQIGEYSAMSRIGLKGNGWILPGPTGSTVRAALGGGTVVTLWRQAELSKLQMAEMKTNATRGLFHVDKRTGATWKSADLAADVERLLKRVQGRPVREEKEDEEGDTVSVSRGGNDRDWEIESSVGPLLLFTATVYQRGLTNEANQVCQQLFERFGGSRKVVAAGVEEMARQQLEQAKAAFEDGGDWKAYADTVDAVAARFAKAWPKAPAARLLATRLRDRAEGRLATLAAEGLSAEDAQLARELAEQGIQSQPILPDLQNMAFLSGQNWILQQRPLGTNATAAERLMGRGVAAVPLLIALLPDRTPLPPTTNPMAGFMNSVSYSSSSTDREPDYSDPEVVEAAAAQLPGPMTLGAWARSLLLPVVQEEESRSYELMTMSVPDLQDRARAWYAENKGRTAADLARAALKSTQGSQRQVALQLLLTSTNAEDQALVEAALLEGDPDNPHATFALLQSVAQQRGSAVSGLVERVLTNLLVQMKTQAAAAGQGRQAARMDAWITNQVADLRALVSGRKVSFEDAIREWMSRGEADDWSFPSGAGFQQSMEALSPRDLVAVVLSNAVATSGTARVRILSLTHWAGYMEQRQEMSGKPAPTNKAVATDFADQWRVLLNDLTASPDDYQQYYTNVASVATLSYVTLFDETFEGRMQNMGAAFDPGLLEVLRGRALALLDGKTGAELPELPAADQVPDARRTEVRSVVLAAAPEKRHDLIMGLSSAERLWLFEASQEDSALLKALLPEMAIVRTVRADKLPALAGRLRAAALNQPISRNLLETCLAVVSNREAAGIMITGGDMMRGATLLATAKDGAPEMGWMNSMGQGAPAMTGVVAMTYVDNEMIRAFWPIGQPVEVARAKPAASAPADAEDALDDDVGDSRFGGGPLKADAASQSNFWRRVSKALEAKPEPDEDGDPRQARYFGFTLHDPSNTNEVDEVYPGNVFE